MTGTKPCAQALVSTYFDNHPHDTTQDAYRAKGLTTFAYWHGELTRIFGSTLTADAAFLAVPYLAYYSSKYSRVVKIADMDVADKTDIFRAFVTQLGMHWSIFPFGLKDF